jgi:predicted transcriptional regulator
MTTVKTPELSAAMSAVMRVIDDADKGVADASQAKLVIGASNTACRIVKSDIDRRTGRTEAGGGGGVSRPLPSLF